METVDVLIIVMAAVAIVGSGAGVLLYESPNNDFAVTFSESGATELDAVTTNQNPGNGGPLEADIAIDAENLTSMSWEVAISATGGSPLNPQAISYDIVVFNASGQEVTRETASISGTDTSTSAPVDIPAGQFCTLPEDEVMTAADLATARDTTVATHACSNGMGSWKIEITITGDIDGQLQRTHQATVTPTITTFSANVQPDVPSPSTA